MLGLNICYALTYH